MSDERKPTALVSGGSRGLGGALVDDLRRRGYRVATFSRSASDLIREQEKTPEDFFWSSVDAADMQAVDAFVKAALAKFGAIDVLVNNAGIGADGILTLTRTADIQAALAINLELAIMLSRACLKSMLREGGGSVINITSVNGIRGHAGVSVYSATKAALDGLTRSLAREVGAQGIRVNSVAPGYFESDMTADLPETARARIVRRTPLGRLGKTEDLVGVVGFLLSDDARFITGQTIVVDGGLTC